MTVVEFAEAIIALDRERFEAAAEARSLLSRLRQAEADARGYHDALLRYGGHLAGCEWRGRGDASCTCGYGDAIRGVTL